MTLRDSKRLGFFLSVRTFIKLKPTIVCEGQPLDNVFAFKYLGTNFTAHAEQIHDVKARIAQAMVRCVKLWNILDEDVIDLTLKLRLYAASVCSVLTFGCETWNLDKETLKFLDGANSRMLSRFTCKTIPQEARPATTSFNLIRKIRQRRLRWVGHILRSGPSRIIYKDLVTQRNLNHEGNLLTDVPPHVSMRSLSEMDMDRAAWSEYVNDIPHFYWKREDIYLFTYFSK